MEFYVFIYLSMVLEMEGLIPSISLFWIRTSVRKYGFFGFLNIFQKNLPINIDFCFNRVYTMLSGEKWSICGVKGRR